MDNRAAEKTITTKPSVWSIAGPSIAVFLMATIAGVLIIRIVAGLGTPAVAAVTAGQRINFVMVALLMGMGAATTALVSRAWGAQDKALAIAYTRLSLIVALALALALCSLAIIAAEPLATFFKLHADAHTLAVTYIRWLSLFGVAQAVVMILSTAFRAIGDAKTPLYLGIFANGSSVLFAYGFAYGQWGLPELGVKGAAIGWGLAYSLCALAYLVLWISNRLPLHFSLPRLTPEQTPRADLSRFIKVCLPATVEQMVMQGAMLVFIWFVAGYGNAAFAAYGVGLSLFAVSMVVGLGFSIASSTLVGQHLGAGDCQGAVDSANHALRLSLITMSAMGIASVLLAEQLATLMVDDPEVARLTTQLVIALALIQPLLGIDFALGGAMRGAGDTRFSLIVGIVTILGVRLPLAAFFVWQDFPVVWVYSVFIADQLVKSILIWRRFKQRRWLRALNQP